MIGIESIKVRPVPKLETPQIIKTAVSVTASVARIIFDNTGINETREVERVTGEKFQSPREFNRF